MKFVYHGAEDGEEVGIDPGFLDAHQRPLVPPSIVAATSERAKIRITAGKAFLLDHTDPRVMPVCDSLRSNRAFQLLDREALPSKVHNPLMSSTPHKHFTNNRE